MKRSLKVTTALISALTALTLALVSLALANDTSPPDSPSKTAAARPHSPSSGVYTLYDSLTPSDVPTATFQWLEINSSADFGWNLGGDFIEDGDVSPTFPLGFIFPFYDGLYTEFRISEKGYIFFEEPGTNVGGGPLPDEIPNNNLGAGDGANNFIAPFAGDLFGYPGISQVYVRNDATPRRTIIEFENVVWCCGQNNPRTFQIILEPDGSIQTQYLKLVNFPGPLDNNKIVRVGLENLNGSTGDVYNQGVFDPDDTAFWQDNLAIRYTRDLSQVTPLFLPDSRRVWDDPGQTITLRPNLYLLAAPGVSLDFNIMTSSLEVSSALSLSDWADNITHTASVALQGTFSDTVQVDLTVPVGADFSDIATATFVAESTSPPLVTDTFTVVYGPAHRDLQIEKTLDPNIAPAENGALRYRLTITNTDYNNSNRPGQARGVLVGDVLPAGLLYEECRRGLAYRNCDDEIVTGTLLGQTVITWNVGVLGVDEVETIYLELRNQNSGGTPVNNSAGITLTDGIELGYPDRNLDSTSFIVDSAVKSELNIRKTYPYPFNGQNFVGAGQVIPFDVYYYNDGRDGHLGNAPISATVVDVIPEGTTFDRATLDFDYNDTQIMPVISGPLSRTLTFNDLTADNGNWNRHLIRIWVSVPQTMPVGTVLTNQATIDDGISNDTDDETVIVASNFADPFVDKGPPRDEQGNIILPEPGKDYTYWITYGNRSVLTDAIDFALVDVLPPEVTLVSASTSPYLTGPVVSTVSGQTVVSWFTDTLPAGAMGQLLIIVRVDGGLPKGAPLVNQVGITYTGTFTPSSELDDTDTLTVEIASELNGSAKLVSDSTPNAGDTVEYTIVVSNSGPAMPFTVTDALPPELVYVSYDPPAQGNVTVNGNSLSWSGGTVGANSQETFTFRAKVAETAQLNDIINNTAQIEGSGGIQLDRSVKVTIAGGVFGSSSKAANPDQVASGGATTYRLVARNNGSAAGAITITDSLPAAVTLIPGSFSPAAEAANVSLSPDNQTLTWITTVDGSSNKTLEFQVTVAGGLADGVTIENVAFLDTVGAGPLIPLAATITIDSAANDLYLPVILK